MRFFPDAEHGYFKPMLKASLWTFNLTYVLSCFNYFLLGIWDTSKPKCYADPLVPRNEDLSDGGDLVTEVG